MTGPPRSPPSSDDMLVTELVVHQRVEVEACEATSWNPSGPTSLSPKPRRSGTITSKPAAASGSITFQKMRLVSGQPCTHNSGTPPNPSCTKAWRKPRGDAAWTGNRCGSSSGGEGGCGTRIQRRSVPSVDFRAS